MDERIEYLYDYAKIIVADNIENNEEQSTFNKFCIALGFKEENITSIYDLLIQAAKNDVEAKEIVHFVHQNDF